MLQRLVLQLNLAKQAEQKTLMMRFLDGEITAVNYDSAPASLSVTQMMHDHTSDSRKHMNQVPPLFPT